MSSKNHQEELIERLAELYKQRRIICEELGTGSNTIRRAIDTQIRRILEEFDRLEVRILEEFVRLEAI